MVIGLVVFRYRLYDIDRIIRRTLSYALLMGLLAMVFFGGVVLIQWLFQSLAGSTDSPLVTVISTLAIAALFNPLRIRRRSSLIGVSTAPNTTPNRHFRASPRPPETKWTWTA